METQWKLVAKQKHWSADDEKLANAAIRNAVRLLDDAALLQTYGRWGTAYTLAIIAFEEAGKVALQCWSDDEQTKSIGKSWTFHLKKQTAAACLLMADFAKDHIDKHPSREGMSTLEHGSREEEEALRHDLATALQTSKARKLLDYIALHAVERTKHVGFYVDDWNIKHGMSADQFSEAESVSAMGEARTAIRLLRSAVHVRIAGAVYRTSPLQEHMVAAGRASLRKG